MNKENNNNSKELVQIVINGMQEIKASNISILNLKKLKNAITDYFIICDAESSTQVSAIADSVEVTVKKELKDEELLHKEGFENASWILLDFGVVVVHVFQSEAREFYNIEDFWADAEIEKI